MKHDMTRTRFSLSVFFLLVAAVWGFGLRTARAASVTIDLCATTGSVTMPDGATVAIWGYAPGDCSGAPTAQLPGPVIDVSQGDSVTVVLHNNLSEATALYFQGVSMAPDLTGAPAGGSATYTFTAAAPGTYLYEAGLLPNAQHQVAMGMAGGLIVRPPAAGQAYGDPSTAFDNEALLLLSEIDPALNNSANPAAFDLRGFAPRYWLIDGKAYPETAAIPSTAGSRVLLRYANAGLQHHSMALLGLRQTVIAGDGSYLSHSRRLVAETIAPGETLDAIAAIPAGAPAGSRFPVYDGSLMLRNSTAAGFGGMLTFISLGTATPGGDTTGPVALTPTLAPNPTNGMADVAVQAVISDAGTGGANIQAAEFYIDSTTGTPVAMAPVDGLFDSPAETVGGTISTAALAALASGSHTIYVRGQDALGNWGNFNFAQLNLDKLGPSTAGLTLTPNPTGGTASVALHATASDQTSGGSSITAAEYFIDAIGATGAGAALTPNVSAPIASIDAVIPAAVVSALAEGDHPIYVHSMDALGNWGAFASITLRIDRTGPAASGVAAVPNPNNGTLPLNTTTQAVRVSATISDLGTGPVASNVAAGESFIDAVGMNGSGVLMVAADGLFNSPTEAVYMNIPLSTVVLLANGPHTIYVHGRDAAGNWGGFATTTLVVDKLRPVVSGVTAAPNPTNGAVTFVLSATANDATTGGSNITRAEWYEGADPGAGNGVPMAAADGSFNSPTEGINATINVVTRGWAAGSHTLYVRARDAAGSWSLPGSVVVNVILPNAIFADGFESGSFSAWNGGTTGAGLSVTTAAALTGTYGMQVALAGNAPRYVTDLTPVADPSYHARFYFNPNGAQTGNNLAQGYAIFAGLNAANTPLFQVQYRRQNAGGGTYQVRLAVLTSTGTVVSSWFNISNNAAHPIEVAWQSGTNAAASFYTDGVLRQTLSGLNTGANLLESVQLGPSANLTGAASGTMFFDAFASTRTTVIGP